MTKTLRRRALGLLFLVVVVSLVALSIAFYNKAFTKVVLVKLDTDKVGNQLAVHSDVKARGVLVGEVSDIRPTADGAELSLAIMPDQANLLPDNVSARFLPKTLFGERYVALQIPEQGNGRHLTAGTVIAQDKSQRAVELESAFQHLLPVLQAVQPQKLSSTLTAISTALHGRGKQLGQTLSKLGKLVGDTNPHLPQLTEDLKALASASDTFNDASPDFIEALNDFTVTSKTLVDEQRNLESVYGSLTTSSRDLARFLDVNQSNLIQLASSSRPTAELLAKYAPEYPCFLKLLAETVPVEDKAWGKGTDQPGLHVTAEITPNRGPYVAGRDEPKYLDKRGPRCYDFKDFPQPFPQYPPDGPLKDGAVPPPAAKTANVGLIPSGTMFNGTPSQGTGPSAAPADLGLPNSAAEVRYVNALIGPTIGVQPDDMPSWSTLLLGPVMRGSVVDVK
ncbi:MCE family protein [Labedaea rhizosphaerae]|uniref:Virulence factor Mce-like protein n=1 Tax=Labedaea rhizosphaerae TaxID=598644 RepID=A0A4R6SNJ7_LABRH|nr:MCE family protein [Labedaea rhizosphaerae]TDQ05709.1 virulence factor Mce-like protein [Labedaea rhizosphaerae]